MEDLEKKKLEELKKLLAGKSLEDQQKLLLEAAQGLISDQEEEEKQKIDDIDKVTPRDHHKPFSVAQFKTWRKNMVAGMNEVIGKFQKEMVGAQARVNLAWNGMNAVILALVRKGLITERDISEAGAILMKEARENIDKAKAASELGQKPAPGTFTKVPLEQIRDDINKKMTEDVKE